VYGVPIYPPMSSPYPVMPIQYPPVVMPVAFAPNARTNGMAIAAFVCPLVLCALFPLGIIFGHIALSQIARNGEGGKGLAIAGLVISYAIAAILLMFFVFPFLGLLA
jgi:peptidyl-prolyl cis-trans isomerase B (cyclophilin B)